MTSPVSSANSSVYDPNAQFSAAEGCDARQLVRELDTARRSSDCSLEAKNATLSCAKAGVVAAGTLLLSPTGVGAFVGVPSTFAESISCGKDLRSYYDCESP